MAVAPLGNLEEAVDAANGLTTVKQNDSLYVSGWAADSVDGSPLSNVVIYIDGRSVGSPTLGIARPDVSTYFNNSSYLNSGYIWVHSASDLSLGSHAVSVTATNSAGTSTTFGPLSIAVISVPIGNLDNAVDASTGLTTVKQNDSLYVNGWAADPVKCSPLSNVKVYIDGVYAGTPTVGIARPDVSTYFNKSNYLNSGYTFVYSASGLSVGAHAVTVTAANSTGDSTTFGPLSINVTAGRTPPTGNLDTAVDSVTATSTVSPLDSLYVSGWAADYGDNGPATSLRVLIDGIVAGDATLGGARPDVASYFNKPTWLYSGWTFVVSASTLTMGSHSVSAVASDSSGLISTLGPLAITVAPQPNLGPISTVAGNGTFGYNGDDIPATSAELGVPNGVAVDTTGNVYIADNARIRKVDASTGVITTVAGEGPLGVGGYNGDNIPAIVAELSCDTRVAVDTSGNLYIGDVANHRVRKVSVRTGLISTVAGNGTPGYNGDGIQATSAELWDPTGVVVDDLGNLYIADYLNNRVRRVDAKTGIITTVAGGGFGCVGQISSIGDGCAATSAQLRSPYGVALDGLHNLYIADSTNNAIRKVSAVTGVITTVAGMDLTQWNGGCTGQVNSVWDGCAATSVPLLWPTGVAVDAFGNLYIAQPSYERIRMVSAATGVITTVAGNGTSGFNGDGASATSAELSNPFGVAVDISGNLYIADSNNERIRKVSSTTSTSIQPVNRGLTDASEK